VCLSVCSSHFPRCQYFLSPFFILDPLLFCLCPWYVLISRLLLQTATVQNFLSLPRVSLKEQPIPVAFVCPGLSFQKHPMSQSIKIVNFRQSFRSGPFPPQSPRAYWLLRAHPYIPIITVYYILGSLQLEVWVTSVKPQYACAVLFRPHRDEVLLTVLLLPVLASPVSMDGF
jgi:hypothetical protein